LLRVVNNSDVERHMTLCCFGPLVVQYSKTSIEENAGTRQNVIASTEDHAGAAHTVSK
jgi:hypothetical protein